MTDPIQLVKAARLELVDAWRSMRRSAENLRTAGLDEAADEVEKLAQHTESMACRLPDDE